MSEGLHIVIDGQLEIDAKRGVVWFNDDRGVCRLRVSGIPKRVMGHPMIDVVFDRQLAAAFQETDRFPFPEASGLSSVVKAVISRGSD